MQNGSKLKSPVLAITGSEDGDAVQAAVNFLSSMKATKRPYEVFIYAGAAQGFAQPLFNGGENYNPEAVHTKWVVVEDFLDRALRN